MATKKIAETDLIIAWIPFFICTFVLSLIFAMCAGGAIGFVLGMLRAPSTLIQMAGAAAGWLVQIPISYLFFRIFVKHFIVKKLEVEEPPEEKIPQ